ncbi:ABC transporter permease [Tissierella creatinini]|nr:ABC transporter permease [Tissierella creatinini]TJX63546.1 ABC transporter permease [Soehngenia saccharolytica]
MKKLDTILIRSIKNTRGQFISITFMIVLALTIYVSLSMVGDNLYNSIFHYYEITNFGDIFVEASRVPKSAIDGLASIEGVAVAQGRISADVPLRVEDPREKVNVRIVSLPDEEKRINNLYTLEGQGLNKSPHTTVVLKQFYDGRKMSLGDRLTPYIGGKEYSLDIIGVVGSPEYIYLMEDEQTLVPAPEKFGVIYVSEDFAGRALGYQGSYNELVIKIDENHLNRIDSIVDDIEDKLDRYGVKRIIKREDHLSHSMMMQEVESLQTMTGAIIVLFLSVAGIIINIMLSRMVKRDRTSIGVMKAIGYTNSRILMHYAKYSILMGLIGSIIGILLSIPLSKALTDLYIVYMNIPVFQMKLYYRYFILGLIITTIFCIISGLIGARSVLNISPAESMRPETPKSGKRIWLEKVKVIWKRISFSWKMVIRNISRNKRRSAFLVLGIGVTFAITIVPIYLTSVFKTMFDIQYGEFQKMDYSIDFAVPMNKNAILGVSQLIDSEHIEPKAEMPFELNRGWRKETISVIALSSDTIMYDFKDQFGGEFHLPRYGIVLSEILAKSLKVQVGDKVLVKTYISDKDDKTIKVKGIVKQYLGSNAYMDLEQMYDLLDERDLVTGALINSEDDVVTKFKDVKNIRQIQSIGAMRNSLLEFMDTMLASVGTMMIFGGVLGFAIVYNITIVSINERIMEFSSLRVLGFENKQIYRLITRENNLMTIFGILLGIPLGYGMCLGLSEAVSTDIYSIPVMIKAEAYIIAGLATLIFVSIAQLATIRKVHNINFMEALKNRTS